MGQTSNLDAIANDQQIPNPACVGESMSMSLSGHISSVAGTKLTSLSVLSQAEGSDHREGNVGFAKGTSVSSCTDRASPDKHLPESAQTEHETEKAKNGRRKYKKEINLPRRASKRLAGIKVDPVPELKTSNRGRRVAVKQSGEGEVITNVDEAPSCLPDNAAKPFDAVEDGSKSKCKFDSTTNTLGQHEYSYGKLSTLEKVPENTVEGHGTDKGQECFSFLPLESQATVKEHVRALENGDKVDAKLGYSFDLPLGELLTDPCIAFAIETLTGVTLETLRNSKISSEFENIKHSETLAAAEGHHKQIKVQNMADETKGFNVLSPENLAIPKERASDAEIDEKANDNSGSSSEAPLDISWMDPCIEFAIKTLTGSGTTPLDTDPYSEMAL